MSKQHFDVFKKCLKTRPGPNSELSSFMWDHNRDNHGDQDINTEDFQFDILNSFTDPMTRQIEEAVRIQRSLSSGLHIDRTGKTHKVKSLNRKNEHFCAKKRFNYEY